MRNKNITKNTLTTVLIISVLAVFCKTLFGFDSSSMSLKLYKSKVSIFKEKVSRFILTSKSSYFTLPQTNFQRSIKIENIPEGKKIIIETGNIRNKSQKNKPVLKDLIDTKFLNLKSDQIKSTAYRFKKSKNPVYEIELFVYRHITDKKNGIPLLPAVDIFNSKSGDCTEHTILTVALLRSIGIPCRAIAGMILVKNFQGFKNRFVYHMWAHVYYKNRWHLIDATRPGRKNLNRYIAFSCHSLRTEMPLSYLNTISAIQEMQVMYIKK